VRGPPSESPIPTTTSYDEADPDEAAISCIEVFPGQRIVLRSAIAAAHVSLAILPPGADERISGAVERIDPRTIEAAIDTRGMAPGKGWWYLLGEDDARPGRQTADAGRFIIRDVPAALLGLAPRQMPAAGRFAMLGAIAPGAPDRPPARRWRALAAAGAIGAIAIGLAI